MVPVRSPWPAAGSGVLIDPAWRTDTLANGVRYAVRRGRQPPGTIAVRVRMDVGALMKKDDQQGWSHLLEHMVFRGTAHYPDGEGIRVWQRLGANFGSDTNAFTSLRATTFVLDLPRADAASYGRSLSVRNAARHGPAPDALAGARTVATSAAERALTDNGYWMNVLSGDLGDPRYTALAASVSRWDDVTPEAVKAVVARDLRPDRAFTVEVLPVAPVGAK